MKKIAFRTLCLGLVLALCLPMVACDVQFGGLLGKLLEKLPEMSQFPLSIIWPSILFSWFDKVFDMSDSTAVDVWPLLFGVW